MTSENRTQNEKITNLENQNKVCWDIEKSDRYIAKLSL